MCLAQPHLKIAAIRVEILESWSLVWRALPRKPVATAIESYLHAPRVLSVAAVIRQLASAFPDLDRTTIAHRVRKSRRMDVTAVARSDDPV